MAEKIPRGRIPNTLKAWASEAAASYILEYCQLPILSYGIRHALGDFCREENERYAKLEEIINGGISKEDLTKLVDKIWHKHNILEYNLEHRLWMSDFVDAIHGSTPKLSFRELVDYLLLLKEYYWNNSPLGPAECSTLRIHINRSILRKSKYLDTPSFVTNIIYILFCYEVPEFRYEPMEFSRDDDCEHLGKLLEELIPFHIRSLDVRSLRFRSIYPLEVILQNSEHMKKILIGGIKSTFFFCEHLLVNISKNLKEIAFDMTPDSHLLVDSSMCLPEIVVDMTSHHRPNPNFYFNFFFGKRSYPEVLEQFVDGRDCKVTFPNLERLYIKSKLSEYERLLSLCLLQKYGKLTFNSLGYKEIIWEKQFMHFSRTGKEPASEMRAHANSSCYIVPGSIAKESKVKSIYYNITERRHTYGEWMVECLENTPNEGIYLLEDDEPLTLEGVFLYTRGVRMNDMYAMKSIEFALENYVSDEGIRLLFEFLNKCLVLECLKIHLGRTTIEDTSDDILVGLNPLVSINTISVSGTTNSNRVMNIVEKIIAVAPNLKLLSLTKKTINILIYMHHETFAKLEILHVKDLIHCRNAPYDQIASVITNLPSIQKVILQNSVSGIEMAFGKIQRTTSLPVIILPKCPFFNSIQEMDVF